MTEIVWHLKAFLCFSVQVPSLHPFAKFELIWFLQGFINLSCKNAVLSNLIKPVSITAIMTQVKL